MSTTTSSDYNEVINRTDLTNYVAKQSKKEFKSNPANYNDNYKKDNAIIQLKIDAIADPTVINAITNAETAATSMSKNARIGKMINAAKKAINNYLTSVIINTAYTNAPTLTQAQAQPQSTQAQPPLLAAISSALPTPIQTTPSIISTTVSSTPASSTPASSTTNSPYEVILDTDKMKFFVYNLFAHDLAHDLFPSNEPGRYTELQTHPKLSTATIVNWLATKHTTGKPNLGGSKEKDYLDDKWSDSTKLDKIDDSIKDTKTIIKSERDKRKPVINKYTKTTDENDIKKINEDISEIEEKINDEIDIEIADNLDILGNSLIKSVGLTLEQKGLLYIKYGEREKKEEYTLENKNMIIIDLYTIEHYFHKEPNKIYEKNPIYPGFIYYDNQIFNPYDIDVKFNEKVYTISFNNEKIKYTILYDIKSNPNLYQITIYEGDMSSPGKVFVKVCNQDIITTRHNCEINFKQLYNKYNIDINKNLQPRIFADINNYIITELENDLNSDFYDFYPDFLLKKNPDDTNKRFNTLFNDFSEQNFNDYYNHYQKNFECFDNKVCTFLQEKEMEDESKYESLFEKQEIPSIKKQLKKNIQQCKNRNFLDTLSKLFVLIFVRNYVPNNNDYLKNLSNIFGENFLEKCAKNENNKGDKNTFLIFKQLIYLHLKNYNSIISEETSEQKGGGNNDDDFINCAQVICTAIKSIMYYLKDVTSSNNTLIQAELDICNNIILNHSSGTDLDTKIINTFYQYTTFTAYNSKQIYYYNTTKKLPSGVSQATLPTKTFWEELDILKPPQDKLYLISNAAPIVDSDDINNSDWFCPLSSIIDGQPQCSTYINKENVIEKGTLYVTVRNEKSTTVVGGGIDPNYMSYTIKVEPSTVPNEWNDARTGKHYVNVSALLIIGNNTIINYGKLFGNNINASDAIKIDLDDNDSYLDAKLCLKNLICLNIGLLQGNASPGATKGPNRSWGQLMSKIDADDTVPETKYEFRLHDKDSDTYSNVLYTSTELRSLILRTSVIKSLGDYFQELNMVVKDSGYINNPITITAEKKKSKNAKIIKNDELRVGFSNDRPSGVRSLLLRLYGKNNPGNPKSGINDNSVVGYYGAGRKTVFLAYEKSKFKPTTDTSHIYTSLGGKRNINININPKTNINKVNKTKRHKNLTKKRNRILKNKKISKRNNKGTRKRR
jgi:hypothetical protein